MSGTFTPDTRNVASFTGDTRNTATFTGDSRTEGDYLWTNPAPWQLQFPWQMSGLGQLFIQDVRN